MDLETGQGEDLVEELKKCERRHVVDMPLQSLAYQLFGVVQIKDRSPAPAQIENLVSLESHRVVFIAGFCGNVKATGC